MDALINTGVTYPSRKEPWGGVTQRLIGKEAGLAIDIETGKLVTVWDSTDRR